MLSKEELLGAIARGWCHEKNTSKTMDSDLAIAIADEVLALNVPKSVKLQEIEQYRMQMAAISTAALGYWKEGDAIHADYDTVPLRDVAKLYAKYDALFRAQADARPVARFHFDEAELDALYEAIEWAKDEGLPGTAEHLQAIFDAHNPEASAPGLSDEVERQNAGFDRCFEALGFSSDHGFERSWSSRVLEIQRILARASAATVGEASDKWETEAFSRLHKTLGLTNEIDRLAVLNFARIRIERLESEAAQQQAEPAFVTVPIKPTAEMVRAGNSLSAAQWNAESIYTAMVSAARTEHDCGCETNEPCAMKTNGTCWRAD